MKRKYLFIVVLLIVQGLVSCTPKMTGHSVKDHLSSFPLRTESDLDVFISTAIGNAQIVVIGEGSHGTSEFYSWRAALTKKLIATKGFTVVAVEGDWKDCYEVDRWLHDPAEGKEIETVLKTFDRFPSWLWRNEEVADFLRWAKQYNANRENLSLSFYGLDLFSINESLLAIKNHDDGSVRLLVNKAIGCFGSFLKDESAYALQNARADCGAAFSKLDSLYFKNVKHNKTEFFNDQLIRSAVDGEKYYCLSRTDRIRSWNIREQHMLSKLNAILGYHGAKTKIVLWVHNTHAGNAHYSETSRSGQTSLGELLKLQFGKQVYLVGSDSYEGTVIAASRWGGNMETFQLLPAQKGSVAELFHQQSRESRILLTADLKYHPVFKTWVSQRAVGAVYRPEREVYVPSVLPGRYDALIFIDSTHALHPLR